MYVCPKGMACLPQGDKFPRVKWSEYIGTMNYDLRFVIICIIDPRAYKVGLKGQVTFFKLCLLVVCLALIIPRLTIFFFIKVRFLALKMPAQSFLLA